MHREPLVVALSIVRNSAASMTVGLLAKGMGLVLAVLIARFLGPEAMGLFALLFSIALLVEFIAPLGLQDVLIRDVSAHPAARIALWKHSAKLAAAASLVPAAAFLIAAYFYRDQESVRNSLVTLAVGMPFSAMALVGQAVLQGLEKVLYLIWATFLTRVASLVALFLMLYEGAGVEAAFISRVLFQASSAALFIYAIFRDRPPEGDAVHASIGMARALPFAVNRVLTELTTRAPLLLLPILFTLKQIGLFDAADRIRFTLGIMVAVATTAIMPAFSRSFAGVANDRVPLVSFSVKYVCVAISLAAIVISIFADVIVAVLYGARFAQSALLLQVLVWTQVLVATDTVLKQAMIASRKEYAVVTRALAGLACLAVLVIALGHRFGLIGAAAAVLTASAATLAMDLRFVAREVLPIDALRFVVKPIACALLAGGVLLLLNGAPLFLRLGAGLLTFALAAVVTRLVPKSERAFLNEAVRHGLGKRPLLESGGNRNR
jgi:O-antigen/teichoic acid export membrane protein